MTGRLTCSVQDRLVLMALGCAIVFAHAVAGQVDSSPQATNSAAPTPLVSDGFAPLALGLLADPPPAAQTAADSGNAQNDANNPLTPKVTFNLHDYYVPSYYGLADRDANQFLLRGLLPHKIGGAPQLFRFTLPIANAPTFPDGSDSGLGDLVLIDWFMFKDESHGLEFGIGPMLVAPTASKESLGAGKWQLGASGIVVSPQKWGILGGLVTFQQSIGRREATSGATT
ncbi:MAG: hypothetical protein QM783_10355 [Phycisphaerales bacterium]